MTGRVRTVSSSGLAARRTGAMTSSHAAGSPHDVTRTCAQNRPRSAAGTIGRSGKVISATDRLTSSGACGATASSAVRTSPAASPGKNSPPPYTSASSTSSIRIAVTTPTLPPAAAQRPEQVGVVLGGDDPQLAVGGDDVEAAHVVGGPPVAPPQHPEPAAERVGDGADRRRGPRQRGQPERRGLVEHHGPHRAGPDPRRAVGRVDAHRRRPPGGQQQDVVGGDRDAVPGGLHPDGQPGRARCAHARHD
ncbi:MAG TPA: hypothetical protein VK935_02925, partial [Actinomycetospora sp.]|nr:hypothetical protein [Actinomycetospora sp.]